MNQFVNKLVESNENKPKPTIKPKTKRWTAAIQMWIRRIHLFSGLFMLPWVLLYGFTAMLFNHPNWLTDQRTTVTHFELNELQKQVMPDAKELANRLVVAASESPNLDANDPSREEIEQLGGSRWTGTVVGVVDDDNFTTTINLDPTNGTGYVRRVAKINIPKPDFPTLADGGMKLNLNTDGEFDWQLAFSDLLSELELPADKLQIRRMPNLEFEAEVNGQSKQLRFVPTIARARIPGVAPDNALQSGTLSQTESKLLSISGDLFVIGTNPRDMSWRNLLLRLHMAHGYPNEKNSRWFWAVAVDVMFVSMVFWGLSGLVMWWQIKRTRRIGWLILILSAATATWLAIGMHWQLVHG